jgi:hypothetical protein
MKNINEDIRRIKGLMNILENEDGIEDYFKQKYTDQSGPHDESDMAPDGMDDVSDVNEKELEEAEISEEGDAAAGGSTTSSGAGTTSKWADVVGSQVKRSQGNQIKTQPWASGITKGPGNQSK